MIIRSHFHSVRFLPDYNYDKDDEYRPARTGPGSKLPGSSARLAGSGIAMGAPDVSGDPAGPATFTVLAPSAGTSRCAPSNDNTLTYFICADLIFREKNAKLCLFLNSITKSLHLFSLRFL